MNEFVRALHGGQVLLMDGAMGTELQKLARTAKGRSLTERQRANYVHSSYTCAGARVLLTNTFLRHASWREAIAAARGSDPPPEFVLGDVGPFEGCTRQTATAIVRACRSLDGVLLETWSSLADLRIFADAMRGQKLPLLVSFTFQRVRGKGWRTFADASPQACAHAASQAGAAALGVNCGRNLDMKALLEIVNRYRAKCDAPIFVRPNAGTPRKTRSGWTYPLTPEAMARCLRALLEAGVVMVGGCCGTTPAHIAAFRRVIDVWNAGR